MTVVDLYDFIVRAGVPGVLLAFIYAAISGRVVFGRELKSCEDRTRERVAELRDERDKWRELALESTQLAGKLSTVVPPREKR